ncbi:MAG: hypothetical protein Aurels2KO_54790 [Aureliella sp.]
MNTSMIYRIMLDSICVCDYERARNYGLILQAWLDDGGEPPEGEHPDDVRRRIATLVEPVCDVASLTTPFLGLCCEYCGDEGPESLIDAIDQRWSAIQAERFGIWSHVGVCPTCKFGVLNPT